MAAQFRCPTLNSTSDARLPAMCLRCGQMLCSLDFCCQNSLDGESVGACTYHAHECSASCGIFLRIRDCQILMLCNRKKGTFQKAPYVDQYGETDQGFRRGNPLYLNSDLLRKLERIWLTHGVHEVVVSRLEYSQSFLFDWQNL